MLNGTRTYSKNMWKNILWKRAWEIEAQDWDLRSSIFGKTKLISRVSDTGEMLIWQLGDLAPDIMRQCGVMAKLVCNASFRNNPVGRTCCELCTEYANEDARHVILHCPGLNNIRRHMFEKISHIDYGENVPVLHDQVNIFERIMGKAPLNIDREVHILFLRTVAKHV